MSAWAHLSRIQSDKETYDLERSIVGSVVAGITADRCGQCCACDRTVVSVDVGYREIGDMEITEAAYAEAQMEIERLRTALENQRRECDRAWREVDFIAKERTEHLEWRRKLANDLDECERVRDVLAKTVNRLDAENLARGNVIGRIAAHLLGQQNNVKDEDVVVAAAQIGGELLGARTRANLGARTRAKRAEDDLMAAHNAVAQMMIRQSIATGHGDTVADMVAALESHIVALRKVVDAFKELHAKAEEWECDGLGLFAQHGWWEAVDEALDALRAA